MENRSQLCNETFVLKKEGYDPFLDYMKGWAILSVVLLHAIVSPHWAYFMLQAVPIFLLIQVFHSYKKGLENCRVFNFAKIWQRILYPFFKVQFFLLCFYIVTSLGNVGGVLKKFVIDGGLGPGSYYPWLYVQFALLLPFLARYLKDKSVMTVGWTLLLLSVASEIFFCLIHIHDGIWRLLCVRYIYLCFLGLMWVSESGVKMTKVKLLLILVSFVSITLLVYFDVNLEPLFLSSESTRWYKFHWFTYYWPAFAVPQMLWWLWKHSSCAINHLFCVMGKYSWEIFLVQMAVFAVFYRVAGLIINQFGERTGMIVQALCIFPSIVPVLMYAHYKQKEK